MSAFPGELFDKVIDQVHYAQNDTNTDQEDQRRSANERDETLANCALVCHAWLRRSRYLQYQKLELARRFSSTPLENQRLLALSDLLRSSSLTFLPHVRSLAIYVPFVSMDSSDFANLASFTYLESIQLKDYALSKSYTQPIELGDIISLLKSFVHLKSLVLEEWYLDSFEQLQDIICACPNLEDLTLDNVRLSIPKMPSDKPTVCRTPPPLRALRVRETDSEGQLVDWLASHPAAIATLTLTCDGFSYNNPHGHLFSKLGSSLKNLQIFCSCKQQGSCSNKIDEMIDLRHNTHLETLTLWSPVNCFALVEQISSSRIQEINIDTDVQSVMPNFEEIDTFLQRGNLAGLDGFNLLGSWPADTTQESDSGSPRFAHLVRYQDIFGLRAFRSGIVRDEDLNQLKELL